MKRRRLARTLTTLILSLPVPLQGQQSPSPSLPPDVVALTRCEFVDRTADSAAERTLARSADDLEAHLTLIGCYFGDAEKRSDWVKHLFWLIDHHPESTAFGFGFAPQVFLRDSERGWFPSAELTEDYRRHWEGAVNAHPRDKAVLLNAALSLGGVDPNLGLSPAKRAVALDSTCQQCRHILGSLYGAAILRINPPQCLPHTPDADQRVATLRREIASLTDPVIRQAAGSVIKGFSGFYHERCGGNAGEAVQFAEKLLSSNGP